jgi:hypothetical protein
MWLITDNIIRGRWWLPPSPSRGESCEFVYVYIVRAPKVPQPRINQLVVWFVHAHVNN